MARAKKTATPAVQKVTQSEIAAMEKVRVQAKNLKDQLKALDKTIEAQETLLTAKLKSGAAVEEGEYVAMLTTAPGRVSIAWKSEAIKLAEASGQNAGIYEATVKAMNPAVPVTSLLISKVA